MIGLVRGMHIQLMADGGADIPKRLLNILDVKMVPLYVYIQEKEYKTGITIDTETFNQKMEESEELPKSSAPSPMDFYESYRQVDSDVPIIMFSLSANLSVTYDNAIMAKDMLLKEEPDRQLEKEYKTGITIDTETFNQKMEESEELPKSSAPSPMDFYESYRQVDSDVPIIMFSLSANLSVTYDNAIMAKDMLLKEEPDRQIEVINSKTASVGIALLIHAAKQQIEQGSTFEEVVAYVHAQIKKT